jgi:hypothetical protein
MFLVKVAYDAYNQQFHLIDAKASQIFEDGAMYFLVVDYFPQQEEAIGGSFLDVQHGDIGHA